MSTNNKWQALSMSERAFLIREAVRNGITDINSIRDTWEHRFDGESNQPIGEKPWYKKLASAISEGSRMARDARIGAVGAEQVRELFNEGKTEEAQELAKQYAKANIDGMTMAAGAANTAGLAGDLAITGVSTLADTAVEGNTDNLIQDLGVNAAFDILGHGAGKVSNLIKSGIKNTRYNISLEDALKSGMVPDDRKSFFEILFRKRPEVAEKIWARELRKSPGPSIDRNKLYYNKEWYKSRLQNKGYSEAEIEKILQHYNTQLDQVVEVSFADLPSHMGGRATSIYTDKNTQRIELSNKLKEDPAWLGALDDVLTHEAGHATSSNGSNLPAGINNSSILLTPDYKRDMNPQLFDYFSNPDEQRVRLLAFADFAETRFGGDYEKAYQFISDTQRSNWLSKSKTYINSDLTDLVTVFKKDEVINGAKKVLSITPIIGLSKENSLQGEKEYREKYGHQFSGEEPNIFTDTWDTVKGWFSKEEPKYLTKDNYKEELSKFRNAFEEYHPQAYWDSKGKKWTVGTGLTYLLDDNGKEIPVRKGQRLSEAENQEQIIRRMNRDEDYARKKTPYWDNYHPELKFQILEAMYNAGNANVWEKSPKYQQALRRYEEAKGWKDRDYDLKDIFQHADWNLSDRKWLGVRSRMRRNPQAINPDDYSKIYYNHFRDSLRTVYDKKFIEK